MTVSVAEARPSRLRPRQAAAAQAVADTRPVAIYVRQSKDFADDELAVQRQLKDCIALCRAAGWAFEVYRDNDYSATNLRKPRPDFQRMLTDVRAGKLQGIVAWKADRLVRRVVELETVIPLAVQHGLSLATVTGRIDLGTEDGRFMARTLTNFAEMEMERKAARQVAMHTQRAERGVPWTPRRPFGYDQVAVDGVQTLVPNEAEAPLVRAAYAAILAGGSQRSIVAEWNAAGVLTTAGNAWTSLTLRKLLLNVRNAGVRAQRGEVVGPGNWPALVDEDTFEGVAALIESNAAGPGTRARRHLLSGIILCGACREPLGVGHDSTGSVYRCRAVGCGKVSRRAEALDAYVGMLVVERLGRPDAAELLDDDRGPQAAALRQRRAAKRAQIAELDDAWGDLGMSLGEYKRQRLEFLAIISEIDAELHSADRAPVIAGLVKGSERWDSLPLERRRAVVRIVLPELVALPPGRTGRPRKGALIDPRTVEHRWIGQEAPGHGATAD